MAGPFPGMDPFIEDQQWGDFHTSLIVEIRSALAPRVAPRYVVEVEERVYLEHTSEERAGLIVPAFVAASTASSTSLSVLPCARSLAVKSRRDAVTAL